MISLVRCRRSKLTHRAYLPVSVLFTSAWMGVSIVFADPPVGTTSRAGVIRHQTTVACKMDAVTRPAAANFSTVSINWEMRPSQRFSMVLVGWAQWLERLQQSPVDVAECVDEVLDTIHEQAQSACSLQSSLPDVEVCLSVVAREIQDRRQELDITREELRADGLFPSRLAVFSPQPVSAEERARDIQLSISSCSVPRYWNQYSQVGQEDAREQFARSFLSLTDHSCQERMIRKFQWDIQLTQRSLTPCAGVPELRRACERLVIETRREISRFREIVERLPEGNLLSSQERRRAGVRTAQLALRRDCQTTPSDPMSISQDIEQLYEQVRHHTHCEALQPGERRVFRQTDRALPIHFVLMRDESRHPVRLTQEFHLRFEPESPRLEQRLHSCLAGLPPIIGPAGEQLRLRARVYRANEVIPDNAPLITVDVMSSVDRIDSETWSEAIHCSTMIHELEHHAGLVDVYDEDGVGTILPEFELRTPVQSELTLGVQDRESFLPSFDCRSKGPRDDLMNQDGRALALFRSGRRQLLSAAEFRKVTQPGCMLSNAVYDQCASNAYATSTANRGSGCNDLVPLSCRDGSWLR